MTDPIQTSSGLIIPTAGETRAAVDEAFRNAHARPDTDSDKYALHHTLGTRPYQAAAGNHEHSLVFPGIGVCGRNTSNKDIIQNGWSISPNTNDYVLFTSGNITIPSNTKLVYVNLNAVARATNNCAGYWMIDVWTAEKGWIELDQTRFHNNADIYLNFARTLNGFYDLNGVTSGVIKVRMRVWNDSGSGSAYVFGQGGFVVTFLGDSNITLTTSNKVQDDPFIGGTITGTGSFSNSGASGPTSGTKFTINKTGTYKLSAQSSGWAGSTNLNTLWTYWIDGQSVSTRYQWFNNAGIHMANVRRTWTQYLLAGDHYFWVQFSASSDSNDYCDLDWVRVGP